MHRFWHILALLFAGVLGACSASHSTSPDGGGAIDAGGPNSDGGMCEVVEPRVVSLTCAAAGNQGSAEVTLTTDRCCAESSATAIPLRDSDGDFDLRVSQTDCNCCDGCRCAAILNTVTVNLGVLEPGTHTVRAGGESCLITIEAPAMCRSAELTEIRAPQVLLTDQALTVSLISDGAGGCGCVPRSNLNDGLNYSLEVCNCCEECNCIDVGYEVGRIDRTPSIGRHVIPIDDAIGKPLTVVDRDQCRPGAGVTGVRVEPPRFSPSGVSVYWAVVTGTQTVCCADPAPAIDQVRGRPDAITLMALNCIQEDCDCLGRPTPYEVWHPLVGLPRGDHQLTIDGFETRFTVN